MSFDIEGKTGLITGANRGIGAAILESCINHGAKKIYAAVRKLDSVTPLIEQFGEKVVAIEIDLNQPETITKAAGVANDVEFVVNNAGILNTATPLADDAIDAFQQEIEVNVYGLMRMAQAFAHVLKSNGGGAFIQLNSVASLKCFTGFATYSASKAAAYSITQGLRDQLGEQGTQVLSIHPGPISTEMADDAGIGEMAEPASLVGEGMIIALRNRDFHFFPDSMAKKVEAAYKFFAANVVEANLMEG